MIVDFQAVFRYNKNMIPVRCDFIFKGDNVVKNILKLFSLVIVLVIVCTMMSSCVFSFIKDLVSGDPKEMIIGTWQSGETEYAEYLNQGFEQSMGDNAWILSVDSYKIITLVDFNEDGTWSSYFDIDSIAVNKESCVAKWTENLNRYAEETMAAEGITGVTNDEFISQIFGYSAEEYALALWDELLSTYAGSVVVEGKYSIENEKLYTSMSTDEEPSTDKYETVTVTSSTLVLTVSDGETGLGSCVGTPATLTKR